MRNNDTMFKPDYAIPPGETLLEILETLDMTQAELAERTGRPKKTINEIIKGKAAITPETALQFEKVLGMSASFWNNLECNYREILAAQEEESKLQLQVEWLKKFPIKELTKLGYIKETRDKVSQLNDLLTFFGVSSIEAWENIWLKPNVAYRGSQTYESSPCSIATWLRLGELASQDIECKPFNKALFKESLTKIRDLTNQPIEIWFPQMKQICADAGVAVVFMPEISGTRVSGATRWLNEKKPLIQQSLRYKSDDHMWFTFFHEAAHILLHGKKEVFIDINGFSDEKEEEANKFASEFLIPPTKLRRFLSSKSINKTSIKALSRELGIAAGIIVGRLQHDGYLSPMYCNDLKNRYEFKFNNLC